MRRVHLMVGVLGVLAFVITGQIMRHQQPTVAALADSARLMFRSRHIYILASALVNLMLGLYMQPQSSSWRARVQISGSALIAISPALLILAFTTEPDAGFSDEMLWSALGLYALFVGSVAHAVSFIRRRSLP